MKREEKLDAVQPPRDIHLGYLRTKDGRHIPVLPGGMVEMAIQELGGEIADLEFEEEVEFFPAPQPA